MKTARSFSLTELLVVSALIILVVSATLGAFLLVRRVVTPSAAEQGLQRDANVIIAKVIKGGPEPSGIVRLSEAVSYHLAGISELHFSGTDGIERWYALGGAGASIIYHHPTATGVRDEVIFAAPQGTSLQLRFWIPSGGIYENVAVGIDVAVSRIVQGRTVTGSVTTMVNVRNHSA